MKTCRQSACMRTTSPLMTSPPRKQSPIFTLSLSVARTSCTRMTPVNSSPGGRGIPSTTEIDTVACVGDKRVTVPSTIEFGAGGCGRTRLMDSAWPCQLVFNFPIKWIGEHGQRPDRREFQLDSPLLVRHESTPRWITEAQGRAGSEGADLAA
jgi:hypothetical protein